jgi:hypothetical protein
MTGPLTARLQALRDFDRDDFLISASDDPREGPDGEFADVVLGDCPDGGEHVFLTQCGVTRCLYCRKVAA